jgi:hypothetical protein
MSVIDDDLALSIRSDFGDSRSWNNNTCNRNMPGAFLILIDELKEVNPKEINT